MTDETAVAPASYERSREDQAWARWIARSADGLLVAPFTLLFFAGWGFAVELGRLPESSLLWLDNPIGAAIGEMIAFFVIMLLWDPLFISNTGTTPGKWIMGVGVRRSTGERLSLWRALNRFIRVWFVGMAAGIPLLSAIFMFIARGRLVTCGAAVWDERLDLKVTHKKRHPALWLVVIVLVFGTLIAIRLVDRYYAAQL